MAAPASGGDFSMLTQTPVPSGLKVPPGHIILNDKWRGTDLASTLQVSVNAKYDDKLGIIDFHPSGDMAVIYLTESDVVSGIQLCKRKIVKLRKASFLRGVVMIEKTPVTSQYFGPLQRFAVLEIGLAMLPVGNQKEAANILVQMINVENKPQSNHFKMHPRAPPPDAAILAAVQSIPKLGEVKAKALLQRFGSIRRICNASEEELASVVGRAGAIHVKNFFIQRN